jgi:hypothetical protein
MYTLAIRSDRIIKSQNSLVYSWGACLRKEGRGEYRGRAYLVGARCRRRARRRPGTWRRTAAVTESSLEIERERKHAGKRRRRWGECTHTGEEGGTVGHGPFFFLRTNIFFCNFFISIPAPRPVATLH